MFLAFLGCCLVFAYVILGISFECAITLIELAKCCRDKCSLAKLKVTRTFSKTRCFLGRVRNMVLSRYELSFKQETLFKVGIKTNRDAIVKECWMLGHVRRGSFDWEIEEIKYTVATVVEKIELSHMSLPCKTIYGPIHLMNGDVLRLSYGKELYHMVD